MTTPSLPAPEFAVAVRGYDRGQVDDYVARLGDFLADAEQRAQHAEAGAAELDRRTPQGGGASYDGLGERVEAILRLASEEADSLRRKAHADLAELTTRRDAVLAELRRVQDVLSQLGPIAAPDAGNPAPDDDQEATQVIRLPTVAATS